MDTLELTLQHRRGDQWPVVAEHRRPGELPRRSEGRLGLAPDFPDLAAFATALLQVGHQPRVYGELLGRVLFRDDIRDRFRAARAAADQNGPRVLLVVEDPALQPLHWERLCAPDGAGGWDLLALDQRTPFSRYLPSLTDRRFPAIGRRDLRALVVLAAPPPDNPYGLARFDAAATAQGIAAALGEIPHDLLGPASAAMGPASLDALAERITAGPYTLLHLVAHGAWNERTGETIVYLLDTAGQVAPVTATDLIERLGRVGAARGLPQLAFLATCEGAQPAAETALGSLAQRLVRDLGIPAVVAMTDRVSIDTAFALAGAFYTRLRVSGEPDLALVEATAGLQARADITVLALFTRLGGRPLFSDRLDGDRSLTGAELAFGIERLGQLLPERAPVLLETFNQHAATLGATRDSDPAGLSPAARDERAAALDALDAIALEVLDSSFRALALDQPVPAWDGRCPFPGLNAFQADERAYFFGREALLATLAARLRAERFLALLGASGSGKSSLVLAGLVPCLPGAAPPAPDGRFRYLTPGADPAAALDRQLATAPDTEEPILLVVDQFEELFTLCSDQTRRQGFVERLVAAWQRHPRLSIVLTMRADFWGDCAPYPALKDLMQAHQELIAPMDTAELRSAMEQQAAAVGLRFEADLSHGILGEVEGEPGAMPLLQHLLLELWCRRHGRWLRASEYRALGGIRQAIAHSADGIYTELRDDPGAQDLLRTLFVRLTRLEEAGADPAAHRDTRQRVPLAELTPAGTDPGKVRNLVQRLADARLVVTTTDPDNGQTLVEVSHEALIRHWPRLRGWLAEDRASWLLLAAVGEQARDWRAGGEREADLPRWGERLQQVEALHAQQRFAPTELERRFLASARALAERERAEREEQQRQRLAALEQAATEQRRRARAAWIGTGVACALLAVAVFFAVETDKARDQAVAASQEAGVQRDLALARQLQSEAQAALAGPPDQLELAVLLALESLRRVESLESLATLRTGVDLLAEPLAAFQHGDHVRTLAFSPDGALLATASADGHVGLWRTDPPGLALDLPHGDAVAALAFSPDGTTLATSAAGGEVRVWAIPEGRPLLHLLQGGPVNALAYSPDGRYLAGAADDDARVWDADTGAEVWRLAHGAPVNGVTFSPDGAWLASASGSVAERVVAQLAGREPVNDDSARIWDLATGRELHRIGHDHVVNVAAFAPDGALLATASLDGTARLWESTTGVEVLRMPHEDHVLSVAFTPDGRTLLSASGNWLLGTADHWARGWEIPGGRERYRLRHAGSVQMVIPGPSGRLIGTASADGTGRVWDGATGAEIARASHRSAVTAIAFAPDGRRYATAGADGSVKLWRTPAADRYPLPWPTATGGALAVSPDGRLGAAPIEGGGLQLRDLADGTPRTLVAAGLVIYRVAWSTDSTSLAGVAADGTLRVWNPDDGRELARLAAGGANLVGLQLGAPGLVAASAQDGTLWVWRSGKGGDADAAAPLRIETAQPETTLPLAPAFALAPAGDALAAAGQDGEVCIWRLPDGEALRTLALGAPAQAVAFSADGGRIAAATANAVLVWQTADGIELARLTDAAGVDELAFSPDGAYLATADFARTATVWDLASGRRVAAIPHERIVNSVAFVDDGRRLASTSGDMLIRGSDRVLFSLWRPEDLAALACQRLTRNLTQAEWVRHLPPDEPYRPTCPEATHAPPQQ